MFENDRRGRQTRHFTTNVPKFLDLKSSSEQIFSRKLPLGAPVLSNRIPSNKTKDGIFKLTHFMELGFWKVPFSVDNVSALEGLKA